MEKLGYTSVMVGSSTPRGAWALAVAFLLLAPPGCVSQRRYAEERRTLIDVGMAGDEVRARIGRPWKVLPVATADGVADQTVEVWVYALTPPPGAAEIVGLVLVAGALIVAAGAGSGSGDFLKGWSSGGGDSRSAKWRFWVGFGPDGRVRGVTNLEKSK